MNPDQAKAAVVVECVLVPREPTRAMMLAAGEAWIIPDPSPFDKGDEARRAIYAAMLAAAPTSPDSSRLGEGLTDAELGAMKWLEQWQEGELPPYGKIKVVCAALRRLSASPGVAGDGA